MHRIAEALRERHRRIIGRQLVVGGGFIAVGTPVALVGAAAGIEHDHAAVLIAVGDIKLLRRFVDHHVGGAAKLAGGIRAARRAGLADLLQEFSYDWGRGRARARMRALWGFRGWKRNETEVLSFPSLKRR